VNDFHSWMTDHEESQKKAGHYEDNKKALLDWLFSNYGYRFIEDYSHFCEVSEALSKKGYLTNPPPSQDDFNKSMEKCYNVS